MKKVYILGGGPSLATFDKTDLSGVDEFIMVNDHKNTVSNSNIVEKLRGKEIHIMCNSQQKGFNPIVFSKLEVKKCLTNRFKPDWDLWQHHKDKQKKHFEGGTLNNLGYLPYIAEDEPYFYAWRGPRGRNLEDMRTYDNRKIEHMPDAAEQYLIGITKDKLIGNCGYYATLYALCELKADHIVYFGMDFYENLKIKKSWYVSPPKYLTSEWKDLRMKYEGEHMKILWDQYLSQYFPTKKFEFFSTAECNFTSQNIIYNKVSNPLSGRTYL